MSEPELGIEEIRELFLEACLDEALRQAARSSDSFVSLTSEGSAEVAARAAEAFDNALAAHDREVKEEAWDEGYSWGWSDAQEAHDVRQEMDRSEWRLSMPNPYRIESEARP